MGDKKSSSGLDKIASILKQMGISEEATGEFVGVCEAWHKEEKDKLQQEYKVRLEKAKKLCVEEVEAHKANLSRGVKMFLENQGDLIRKASEKNAAIAESDAVNKLKQVMNLLNGLDVDSAANAQALQAESKKNAELVGKVAALTESLNKEKAKAAKFGELSEKAMERQRLLESKITKQTKLLSEARDAIAQSGKSTAKTISENKVKASKAKTAKRTPINESDVGKGKKGSSPEDPSIDAIAEAMDV